MRDVGFEKQPLRFLEVYESKLRSRGYSEHEVNALAAVIFDVILGLMKGTVRGTPEFDRIDKRRPGFSCYIFADEIVAGYYSASPDKVHLEYLDFVLEDGTDADALVARLKTEARRAAA